MNIINNPEKLTDFQAYTPTGDSSHKLDNAEKTTPVDNNISSMSFFDNSSGTVKPYFKVEWSPVEDKGKIDKIFNADDAKKTELKSDGAKFGDFLKETLTTQNDYFYPKPFSLQDAPTAYKKHSIVGLRIDQFKDQAMELAQSLYAAGPELDKALYSINTQSRDLLNRRLDFDSVEIDGYGSYGHDAPFVHVYEKRIAELKSADLSILTAPQKAEVEREIEQIQGELDHVFRNKYVHDNSNMYETNAEESMGLVAIHQESRARISEVEGSRKTLVPKFETLSATIDGESKPVFYDVAKEKYIVDSDQQILTDDQVATIEHHPVGNPKQITFRRALDGESLREDFRFDWNSDGYVQNDKIGWVSWAGHCNDKAALEAAGAAFGYSNKGVHEYDSATGSQVHYNRNDLNEILLSFSELGSQMGKGWSGKAVKDLGSTEFAAARDDDRADRIVLSNGRSIPYEGRQGSFEITTIEKDGETYNAKDAFRKYIPADDEKSAEANPLYKETTKGDLINIDLTDAVIKAKINVMSFDEATGYPRKDASDIVLDFANPPDEPIMIDSVMKDAGKREMYEISLDVKEKTWNFQLIKMERQDDGSFKKVPVGDIHKEPFDPSEMVGQHETSLDDPETYVEFLRKTQMTGRGVTAETADGAGVWNGRLETLEQELEMREGSWERVSLDVDARYGANTGRYLAKLNEKGEAEFYVPLAMPADFWWRSEIAFAPEVDNLLNMKARDRGLLSTVNGSIKADAISNFMELLHCGFNERAYTLVHEGQRYYFDDKASWEAEIAKIEGLRSAIYAAPTPDVGTGAPVAANLITESGVLAYNEFKHYEVKAEVDGKITIVLETKLGDADLYVKKGAKASDEEYDLRSINGGEDTDTLIIDAKAGETYNLAILGYALSDYSLTVDGFKAGDVATPPPVLEPVNFTSAGQVTKGQEEHFEIIAVADGELDINMTGSGDADIYLRVGEKPTTNEWDFRPYKGSSTESGKIKVKAGDVIYGMVRGYGTTSDYNLNIKEA